MFTLHPSPTEINKGTFTPSSRRRLCRHHRHLLCRRLRLPLRLLPRPALVERGHWQLPTDQKGLSRGILDVFCSCPMVRLVPLRQRSDDGRRTGRQQMLRAGVLYFALVFGAGFVLGTIRTLWIVPRLSARMAELMETPIMLVITILA